MLATHLKLTTTKLPILMYPPSTLLTLFSVTDTVSYDVVVKLVASPPTKSQFDVVGYDRLMNSKQSKRYTDHHYYTHVCAIYWLQLHLLHQ